MLKTQLQYILLVLASILTAGTIAEFYSSISEMTKVFGYEQRLLQHMQRYISHNEAKLDYMRARLDEFVRERDGALAAGVEYFDSPVNKYLQAKRLTVDWQRIDNLMADDFHTSLQRIEQLRHRFAWPDEAELHGAIDGLLRTQHIYRLQTQDLAAGLIAGVQYGTQLNAQLCFDVGKVALKEGKQRLAHSWLQEALRRLAAEQSESFADATALSDLKLRAKILAALVETKVELLDFRGANQTYHELLQVNPASEEHAKAYEAFVLVNASKIEQSVTIEDEHDPVPTDISNLSDIEAYRYTCNGHLRPTPAEERRLRCGYLTETHAFLLLAPIKAEEVNHDPLLVLFHDVISDAEIAVIRQITANTLERARTLGVNESVISNIRTSQFSFLPRTTHKVLEDIDVRVGDMTNLNMDYAEDHQFSNYGVGGHYAQHHDYFNKNGNHSEEESLREKGNRIATVLFYLTDVEQGGGTAFPRLKRLLMPKKGSAAFWYNLHASGEGDVRTLHGACPIIAGSKWVQNRWIREWVQSDRRPCELWDDSVH